MDVCASFNVVVWFDEVLWRIYVETRCTRPFYQDLVYTQCVYVRPFYLVLRSVCMHMVCIHPYFNVALLFMYTCCTYTIVYIHIQHGTIGHLFCLGVGAYTTHIHIFPGRLYILSESLHTNVCAIALLNLARDDDQWSFYRSKATSFSKHFGGATNLIHDTLYIHINDFATILRLPAFPNTFDSATILIHLYTLYIHHLLYPTGK